MAFRFLILVAGLFFKAIVLGAGVEVLRVEGEVSVSYDKGKAWREIGRRDLKKNAMFRTATGAFLDVRFPDGSLMRVAEKSVVGIDKAAARDGDGAEIQIDVKEGRICAVAGAGFVDADKFEVKTSVAVCGVRGAGSAFDVTAKGLFRCVKGRLVAVYVGSAPPFVMGEGEQVYAKYGHASEAKKVMTEAARAELEREIGDLKESALKADRVKGR